MKYIDEFRNEKIAKKIIEKIQNISKKQINLMEVCGTHTVSIFRNGIRNVLPENIRLLSGPGCPVCVTPIKKIDEIIAISRVRNFIITTFGDMIRVPGSSTSLEKEKAKGADVRMVYSALDALNIARHYPNHNIAFMGAGFETTSPTIASTVLKAKKEEIKNFSVLSVAKIMPPAMQTLLEGKVNINGFLCPGHVSTIIGSAPYQFIAEKYNIPCVISGFEPLDILQAIYMLVRQIEQERAEVEIQYTRAVKPEGNKIALKKLKEVFKTVDSEWRGIGYIKQSGLDFKDKFYQYNAHKFNIEVEESREFSGCRCGDVLKGLINPTECPLFRSVCTPENPKGACMVSSEGTCAAYYKYSR